MGPWGGPSAISVISSSGDRAPDQTTIERAEKAARARTTVAVARVAPWDPRWPPPAWCRCSRRSRRRAAFELGTVPRAMTLGTAPRRGLAGGSGWVPCDGLGARSPRAPSVRPSLSFGVLALDQRVLAPNPDLHGLLEDLGPPPFLFPARPLRPRLAPPCGSLSRPPARDPRLGLDLSTCIFELLSLAVQRTQDLNDHIIIKSPGEIESMREACRLAAKTLKMASAW